jgi:hypothetical protein
VAAARATPKRGRRWLRSTVSCADPTQIADGERAFMKSVREYKDKTEGLFRELRAIRMPRPSMEVPIRRYLSEIKDYST